MFGDNIFYGYGFSKTLQNARKNVEEGNSTVFGYYVNDPERYGVAEFDDEGVVTSIEEKPVNPKSNYAVVGLYFYINNVVRIAKKIEPSQRRELEITSVNQEYLKRKNLKVQLLGRGFAWLDTGTHDSLMEAGQFIETIEKRQGLKVACLEEIDFRMKYIDKAQLRKLAEPLQKNGYDPHSSYPASKASSDHFVRAFSDTYELPTVISNCSNNYGSYQFPEKLIPLFINNIINNNSLPVYGKGENVRDRLFVDDHARAIDVIFHDGKLGETYNIGGFNEWKNIDLIKVMIKTVDRLLERKEGTSDKLITYVTDRAGHDLRYAIDSTKLKDELGWEPSLQFEEGIEKTVAWYLENTVWLKQVTSGKYQEYYQKMYIK